jgi:hypothetical protein
MIEGFILDIFVFSEGSFVFSGSAKAEILKFVVNIRGHGIQGQIVKHLLLRCQLFRLFIDPLLQLLNLEIPDLKRLEIGFRESIAERRDQP